ncbi:MAG: hypothetical protein U0796_23725 [Gemmatales bacterium]
MMELAKPKSNVVCTGCGCLCDDIEPVSFARACTLGREYLQSLIKGKWTVQRITKGDDKSRLAPLNQLQRAEAPGILGLHLVSVETVEAAVMLAQSLNAWLSPWPADPIRFWGHQAPDLGMSRAEVEQAADLVLFIGFPQGVDAVQPRFRERHLQRGLGLGRRQIDINWPEATRLQQVMELRRALKGTTDTDLAQAIRAAKCVQIYVLAQLASEAPEYITHWQHLAAQQRAHRRMGLTLLGATGKARTVTEALTWRTGYPGPLRFQQGMPQYLPHVGEVEALLERGALDTILWVGLDPEPLWQQHPHWQREGITEFVITSGLSPTLDAHVVRGDGVMLRLAGNGPGTPDPLAEILHSWAREAKR